MINILKNIGITIKVQIQVELLKNKIKKIVYKNSSWKDKILKLGNNEIKIEYKIIKTYNGKNYSYTRIMYKPEDKKELSIKEIAKFNPTLYIKIKEKIEKELKIELDTINKEINKKKAKKEKAIRELN